MASSADSFASNISLANFSKATELKNRIWFTIGALIVFRFLSFVPLPGINARALSLLADQTRGGVVDMFNMFTGGSLERMSLIALGVMPYTTASIVVQMASALHPTLAAREAMWRNLAKSVKKGGVLILVLPSLESALLSRHRLVACLGR